MTIKITNSMTIGIQSTVQYTQSTLKSEPKNC
jgi:hypothetical protein